ncbi:MAG: restriction endonuclease subunit S [Allosphingosinicella sp.]|uniref:restriction endonuclease subunit S n=1 Tax=Allosphingosinicella sp. TaxID=2823234 RepID=UPI0039318AE1
MASEWREVTIEEIAEYVAMGPFGSSIKVETFVDDGIPVISGQHLQGQRLNDEVGYNFISEEHANRLARANVQRGDVIFTHAGNIGQVAYIPRESKFVRYIISQRQFYLRPNQKVACPEFIVAFFKTPEGRHKLLANASQVGVPSIARPVSYLRTIELSLPPLSEQRAIAHILGTLDDKIELNRRMSATLEAMARALFKAWLIDFEPVRAKAEDRATGLPPHLAALFPDRLVETEHGEVPEGWQSVRLPEVFEVNPTRALKKDLPAPYLDMANMPTKGHAPDEVAQRPFGSGMRFTNGDTLVARITPCLENGKTAFVDFLQDGQIGWGSTEYIVLRPKAPWPEEAGYLLARDQRFRDFAIQGMTGTSGRQRVPASALNHFQFVSPTPQVLLALGSAVKPWFARSSAAVREARTLAALRDTLLPKLISGELRIKDAETFLDRVL